MIIIMLLLYLLCNNIPTSPLSHFSAAKMKLFVVLVLCLASSLTSAESEDSTRAEPPKKKSGKSIKKNKKQKKVHVELTEVDFDVPEVLTAEPTAMVELTGGEFDFGSQFHFKGEKVTSPKVSIRIKEVSAFLVMCFLFSHYGLIPLLTLFIGSGWCSAAKKSDRQVRCNRTTQHCHTQHRHHTTATQYTFQSLNPSIIANAVCSSIFSSIYNCTDLLKSMKRW